MAKVREKIVWSSPRASPRLLHNRTDQSAGRKAVARPRQDERRGGQSLQRDIRSRTCAWKTPRKSWKVTGACASAKMDRLRRVLSEVIAEVAKTESLDIVLESGDMGLGSRHITERCCSACVSSIRQPSDRGIRWG